MANESQYVTSANGQRVRVVNASPHATQHTMRSPAGLREEYPPHAPAPPPHRTAPTQHYRSHYDHAADSYARAQAMAGNYFSRKPVRANSPRREPPPQLINVASSPPLQTIRVVASTIPEISPNDHPTNSDHCTPHPFRSIHPLEPTHQFRLYPTPVHAPRSFAFDLQPVIATKPNNLDKFHYALDKTQLDSPPQTYTACPGTYCRISATDLGIAYSAEEEEAAAEEEEEESPALQSTPTQGPAPQDWEIKEQRAQMFSYQVPLPLTTYHTEQQQQQQQLFDARERVEVEGQDESRYLDAVDEQQQQESSMGWRGAEQQTASDFSMMSSDGLPGDSAYSPLAYEGYGKREREGFSQRGMASARDRTVRNMVEVKSPGTAGKMIEAARMRGCRG